jgi:hypothetical protein
MRALNSSAVLSAVACVLLAQSALAKSPRAKQARAEAELAANEIFERGAGAGCPVPCGWHNWLCCGAGQRCYTDAQDQARCGGFATATGSWSYYTSIYTETNAVTKTVVGSTYIGGPSAPQQTASCDTDANETPCGSVCCRSDQYCKLVNKCAPVSGDLTTTGPDATGSYSPPLRPTSLTTTTATPTVPFETPVATGANVTLTSAESDNGGGLSGGAIAGIVIGVIFGLLLLFLLLLFCCFKAAFDAILACFGFGRRHRHTETEYIEEHHHHHGGATAAGAAGGLFGRRWHGDRPSRPERPPKKSGGLGGLGAVAAGLGGLAVVLGLKRRHDRKHDEKTEYTGSSYYSSYYSDYTSSSK